MKVIIEKFIETVEDETGIKLTSKDFQLTADSEYVKLTLWGNDLLEVSYEEGELEKDEFADVLLDELFDEYFDLRVKLIEVKLEYLNTIVLPDLKNRIISFLSSQKIERHFLDSLDFQFEDLGYIQGNFSSAGDEEWGFPMIALRISDFEDFEGFFTIDPNKAPTAETLCPEILKKIRGKK